MIKIKFIFLFHAYYSLTISSLSMISMDISYDLSSASNPNNDYLCFLASFHCYFFFFISSSNLINRNKFKNLNLVLHVFSFGFSIMFCFIDYFIIFLFIFFQIFFLNRL